MSFCWRQCSSKPRLLKLFFRWENKMPPKTPLSVATGPGFCSHRRKASHSLSPSCSFFNCRRAGLPVRFEAVFFNLGVVTLMGSQQGSPNGHRSRQVFLLRLKTADLLRGRRSLAQGLQVKPHAIRP